MIFLALLFVLGFFFFFVVVLVPDLSWLLGVFVFVFDVVGRLDTTGRVDKGGGEPVPEPVPRGVLAPESSVDEGSCRREEHRQASADCEFLLGRKCATSRQRRGVLEHATFAGLSFLPRRLHRPVEQ